MLSVSDEQSEGWVHCMRLPLASYQRPKECQWDWSISSSHVGLSPLQEEMHSKCLSMNSFLLWFSLSLHPRVRVYVQPRVSKHGWYVMVWTTTSPAIRLRNHFWRCPNFNERTTQSHLSDWMLSLTSVILTANIFPSVRKEEEDRKKRESKRMLWLLDRKIRLRMRGGDNHKRRRPLSARHGNSSPLARFGG